jgi:hypothetical protein
VKPRAARTGADLCTEEMRGGGDSTGNPRKQSGRRMVQWARVGEQTRVVIFSKASHFTIAVAWSSGIMGDDVEIGMGIMGMPCTSEWDRWELQCFAD